MTLRPTRPWVDATDTDAFEGLARDVESTRPPLLQRTIRIALVILLVVALILVTSWAITQAVAPAGAATAPSAGGGRVPACKTVETCHRALLWQRTDRAHLRHQLAVKWAPVREALICPIATALDVSCAEAAAVNRCESDTDRMVSNSSAHVGWFQESSTFMSDNGLPWANAERWKPVVNVLAAMLVVRREGWGQWTCQP
jgi:hypothetical protein